MRLAVLCTHPIQYYAPLFTLLAQRRVLDLHVFYSWGEASLKKHDPGFGKVVEWDIPLTVGYNFSFVKNVSNSPGSSSFFGIINPSLNSEIIAYNPDAILVFGWAYYSHLRAIIHFHKKIPIWFRGDSTLINDSTTLKTILRRVFLKWVYKHVNLGLYVGSENKRYYKAFGLEERQLVFVPHAIDNQRFGKKTSEAALIRKSFSIDDKDIMILFAGKLEPVKNPLLLLQAFLRKARPNAHLVFVGIGPLERQLKGFANGAYNVHFAGFKNQSIMPAYYQACDLFCLPSTSETWGLAINEAMAAGKAILASKKVGCSSDLIRDRNGKTFVSGDLSDLESKLSVLCSDRRRLEEMGKYSKEIIQGWSFNSQAQVIERLCINEE